MSDVYCGQCGKYHASLTVCSNANLQAVYTQNGTTTVDLDEMRAEITRLQAREAKLREALDRLEDFAQSVVDWSEAYPETVFHEPTPEQFQAVCKAIKATPDCFAAMILREFTKPWGAKARAALHEEEGKEEG